MTACYTHVSPSGGASGLSQVAVHLHGNVGNVQGDDVIVKWLMIQLSEL